MTNEKTRDGADGAHAVRWAQRKLSHSFGMQYSRWHWTKGDGFTLCGRPVQIITDGPAMLPESSDFMEKVTCRHCLRMLSKRQTVRP